MFGQPGARVFTPLADTVLTVGIPGAALLDQAPIHCQIKYITCPGDTFTVEDIKLHLTEGRGHLVLDDLDLGAGTDHLIALFEGGDLADVHAHRGVEFEGITAGSGLWVAEHDTDLHADLVDEDHAAVRFGDDTGQLAQRLGHQTGLQSHMGITHVALDLSLGHQGRHRVDHQHVDGTAAHQCFGDFQGLLTGIRLRDQQVIGLDAQLAGITDIQGVLGIHEGCDAAGLHGLGNDVQGKGRLAGRLRAIDFHDPSARHTTNTQGHIKGDRSGRDRLHTRQCLVVAQAHDGTLAELFLYLAERQLYRLVFFRRGIFFSHWYVSPERWDM